MTIANLPSTIPGSNWRTIAHRGGRGLRPENTMLAFHHAVELGVDAIECDIRATRDGTLVVIHDETVDRTTNGSGRVMDVTYAQLRSLDAGYRWATTPDAADHPYRASGIVIPTFNEVLETFPGMPFIIEIKQADPSIVGALGTLLRRTGRDQNTIVASFHGEVIAGFRKEFPEYATSGAESEIRHFVVMNKLLLGRATRPRMDALQVPDRIRRVPIVTPRFVRVAHAHGLPVHVWTINDEPRMRRMLDMGVDGVITDRPDLLLKVLAQ